MTLDEIKRFRETNCYDIKFDYSEAEINGFTYNEYVEFFKPKSGIPSINLLRNFENHIVKNLNNAIKCYKFNLNSPQIDNPFLIIVKFDNISDRAKSKGYIVALNKETGNIAYRRFSTMDGRWNDFEVLLMEDADCPNVNAPDKYSIKFVSQAIENATSYFRKKGHKLIKNK